MDETERIERSFVVGSTPRLEVKNIHGSVLVRGVEEQSQIELEAVKHLRGRGNPRRTEIQTYQEGNLTVVKTRDRDEGTIAAWLGGNWACRVDYMLTVPADCRVKVHHVSGDVEVEGLVGEVDIHVVDGEVELKQAEGNILIHTVSADVLGSEWSGQARVKTVSGDVRLFSSRLSRLVTTTVSGDQRLELGVEDTGLYRFKTISGDVSVYLPVEQGVEYKGSSQSGRFTCDLPHSISRFSRGRWQASVNGGGPLLNLGSISGNLSLFGQGG